MNIQNEEQELLERIKTDPSFLENANIGLLSNKDFMINAIKNNPKAIQYAPESFYAVDILSALKDGDSSCEMRMPAHENVDSSIDVSIVDCATGTSPFSYSKPCTTFGAIAGTTA